jgi:hypothetical protein
MYTPRDVDQLAVRHSTNRSRARLFIPKQHRLAEECTFSEVPCENTVVFFGVFPMFVPSLSW